MTGSDGLPKGTTSTGPAKPSAMVAICRKPVRIRLIGGNGEDRDAVRTPQTHSEAAQLTGQRPVGSYGEAEAILVGMPVEITHDNVVCDGAGRGREVPAGGPGLQHLEAALGCPGEMIAMMKGGVTTTFPRSEEHTSELQSLMRISY